MNEQKQTDQVQGKTKKNTILLWQYVLITKKCCVASGA